MTASTSFCGRLCWRLRGKQDTARTHQHNTPPVNGQIKGTWRYIKTWQQRTHDDKWQSETTEYMQAEIDELRAENAKLREDLKKQQALTDAGIRLCEIQQAKRPVLANVMEENARLRAVLTEYIAAADNCMLPEGADDIFRFAEAGKAARAALGEK